MANLLAFQPDEHIAQVMEISDYQAAPYLVLGDPWGGPANKRGRPTSTLNRR